MDRSAAVGTADSTPLIAQALGPAFEQVPEAVRRLHREAGRFRGEVVVERGEGLLAGLCAWAARLPPTQRGAIRFELQRDAGVERWTRHFGTRRMRSRLWCRGGRLHERLGLLRFRFDLQADAGGIRWRIASARVLGLPLPRAWFTGVQAHESEHDGRYAFDVRAELPGIGRLVRYRGWLVPAADACPPPVIVFDGVCMLCSGWVRFLLGRDGGRHRFAAMQGPTGRALLDSHGLDPDDPVSFLLVEGARAYTDTDAIIRVLARLGGPWRALAAALRCLPRGLRDASYRLLARHRYRLFGRRQACTVPDPDSHARFLP